MLVLFVVVIVEAVIADLFNTKSINFSINLTNLISYLPHMFCCTCRSRTQLTLRKGSSNDSCHTSSRLCSCCRSSWTPFDFCFSKPSCLLRKRQIALVELSTNRTFATTVSVAPYWLSRMPRASNYTKNGCWNGR